MSPIGGIQSLSTQPSGQGFSPQSASMQLQLSNEAASSSFSYPQQPNNSSNAKKDSSWNWKLFWGGIATALASFIIACQILSRTSAKGMGKTSLHFADNNQKENGVIPNRSVLYIPGTAHSLIEGRQGAHELAKNLFNEPVTLLHIGTASGGKEPIGTATDYLRTGLNMLDLWLSGNSPLGSGRAPLIEALNQHLESLPENHQVSLVGFSAGGLPLAYLSEKAAKRVKDMTFMGVPIPIKSLESLREKHPNIAIANLVHENDPVGMFQNGQPTDGFKAFRVIQSNGTDSHSLKNYIQTHKATT